MNTIANTTNNLKFNAAKTIGNKTVKVSLRLNDEHKNGHEDFAITAEIYEGRKWAAGGCCHEEILKFFPHLKIFVDLHLCDANGAPTYAVANGFYHLWNSTKKIATEYLRITASEYEILHAVNDEIYFSYHLMQLHIPERWKKEAQKAIGVFEEMTGEKFESTATKSNFIPPAKSDLISFKKKEKEGFWLSENVKKREAEKTNELKKAEISELKKDAAKEIYEIKKELEIKLYLLSKNIPVANFIYYKHTKEGCFNWRDSEKKLTAEQFAALMKNKDLPKNVKFNLK